MSSQHPPRILVIGSLNVDHTLRVERIPQPGQTLTASAAFTCFGGKGANQALAAARAGGDVTLIGCVGKDPYGAEYLQYMAEQGVRVQAVQSPSLPTGSAFITVDDAGENSIIVNPGANHGLQPEHLQASTFSQAQALVLQLECPLATVKQAVELAQTASMPVYLNPSPLTAEFLQTKLPVHTLIVNEGEAAQLTGKSLVELQAQPLKALEQVYCQQLIITRGGDATLCVTAAGTISVQPRAIRPVDTVGAGDTFAGALAVALTEGQSLEAAISFANAAGGLATLKPGAQTAIPTRSEIEDFNSADLK